MEWFSNPIVKSWLTSLLLSTATAAATWGVARGLVPAAEQNALTNAIVTGVPIALAPLIAWWKSRQVAPAALIDQVNRGKNGVKVVAADMTTASIPAVEKPLEGPGS